MRILARGKINLMLHVLGRRPDGYHDLELIFQPVSLAATLDISEETGEFQFTCQIPSLATPDNLVCRGYRKLQEMFPERIPPLSIHLIKNIPQGAGMGGGSTDCSALLVWMNRRYGLGLSRQELITIGAGLGADVPACMFSHATLGHGIGEQLQDIRTQMEYPLLLIKPPVSFSTGEMYRRVDSLAPGQIPERRTGEMVRAMEEGDLPRMAELLCNVFEEAVPEPGMIRELREQLLSAGALGSRMTGSGSVVYGIFDTEDARDRAMEQLQTRQEAGEQVLAGCQLIACRTVNRSE